MKIVLQKFIADSGLCSRRKAEELIKKKKVKVNGEIAILGKKVDGSDEIKVNNKKIELAKEKIYIILNKPVGYTCTNRKFKNEKNVFDLVNPPHTPPERGVKERLFVVGRLDKNSRGLVLLTNDGECANKLTHPKFEHEKEYEVKVKSNPSAGKAGKLKVDSIVKSFKTGVDIGKGDGVVKAKEAEYLGKNKFRIILIQGKKRQIRRMFNKIGYSIEDLERTRIGEISLGDLKSGKYKAIKI